MPKIPIAFDRAGLQITGAFCPVYGGGNHQWHLIVDSFYFGRLRLTDAGEWVFDSTPKTMDLESMSEYFGEYVQAWLQ